MKKIHLLLSVLVFSFGLISAQCIVNHSNTQFFNPGFDSLLCIERNVAYNQVIQIAVPDSLNLQTLYPSFPIPYTLFIDSMVITSVTGFPTGISYTLTPTKDTLYGGSHACAVFSGTTNDTIGNYIILLHGTITLHGAPFEPYFSGDTTIQLTQIESNPQTPFHAYVVVINTGTPCHSPLGINDLNSELNASLSVFPNPNNGQFDLKLNTGGRVNGEIVIMDMDGRIVYSNKIDVMGLYDTSIDISKFSKGLYTLQLRTANGFASKKISVE